MFKQVHKLLLFFRRPVREIQLSTSSTLFLRGTSLLTWTGSKLKVRALLKGLGEPLREGLGGL